MKQYLIDQLNVRYGISPIDIGFDEHEVEEVAQSKDEIIEWLEEVESVYNLERIDLVPFNL